MVCGVTAGSFRPSDTIEAAGPRVLEKFEIVSVGLLVNVWRFLLGRS
jgi:hypothetical protein